MPPHFPFEERYPAFNRRPLELVDAEAMCAAEGITVGYRRLHCHGLYLRVHDVPTIFIDEALDDRQRTFALLHELGHHFLHPHLTRNYLRDSFFPYVEIERQANDVALVGIAPHPVLESMHRQHRLTPAQVRRRFPVFDVLGTLSTKSSLHPLYFLRRRIELFYEHHEHPEVDFLKSLKLRARNLRGRHRRRLSSEQVERGVTEVEAVLKWGDPQQVLVRRRGHQVLAKWVYEKVDEESGDPVRQRLYFRDGHLITAKL